MKSDIIFFVILALSFLPFVLFAFFNSKANVKKEVRCQQYVMSIIAVVYSIVLLVFFDRLSDICLEKFLQFADIFEQLNLLFIRDCIYNLYTEWGFYLSLVLFNTFALLLYVILKRTITLMLSKIKVKTNTFIGEIVEVFYTYDELYDKWYIKEHYGQARTFIKTAYYGSCFVSCLALFVSCGLCMNYSISAPFYPVFAVIVIGEMAFFIDGQRADEQKSELMLHADNSKHVVMYSLLRKPLKMLFGDKLSADGTTVNNGGIVGGAIEDVLSGLEANNEHVGNNYAAFIRKKMESGLKPNVDYVRSGYDLAVGKSLLFNTPFYDKLNPYIFYAINRELLTGGKVLIVLGRHGTEDDLLQWTESGMCEVSNIPDLWRISVLANKKNNDEDLPDIGVISRSGVHDLDIHKCNLPFLRRVSFVFIVEPSRLVTTAQIGLNLLIKCCGKERTITFCSVDRNCDGLVDALSHILMTNITEVSATEYPHGMSSYMYWTADDDYLQHRILPGVSRFLGMGTEISMVALRNQVKNTIWYGGEVFPVHDAHWIARQYYYDLLSYAQLPANQENFDKCFRTSFNICNERVRDYSFVTVEDDRNNLFEMRRNFATIAEQQGFINVISSEYMLREYMSANTELFTADAKAIPYITADYARTKRNTILSLCLLMCIDSVQEAVLNRQMIMLNIDTKDPVIEIWKEICAVFGSKPIEDKYGNPILSVEGCDGKIACFEKKETILFRREYSVESGKIESVYTIKNTDFSRIILNDLQNACYIAEEESKDVYIGSELKGHVYQKYLPGQFFTLNGKYYEMVSTTIDNRILVRRASEHIGGRLAYRQVRDYAIHNLEDITSMGARKTVNNIDIHYQFADFSVETRGYWKLHARNDFDAGDLVLVNDVPVREYHHKQILKLDFSKFGEWFTDSVRMTLTNLLNEAFVTLFAENQSFISAVTPGNYDAPLTYSLSLDDETLASDKCIFIIEDSQLDIGLLITVERNANRIFHIISDYLSWNDEQISKSLQAQNAPVNESEPTPFDVYQEDETDKKKSILSRFWTWITGMFKKKNKSKEKDSAIDETISDQQDNVEKDVVKAEKQLIRQQKKAARKERKMLKKQKKVAEKENIENEAFEPEGTYPTEEDMVRQEASEDAPAEDQSEVEVSEDE